MNPGQKQSSNFSYGLVQYVLSADIQYKDRYVYKVSSKEMHDTTVIKQYESKIYVRTC